MLKRFLFLFGVAAATYATLAFAIDVNGQLKKAQLERLSSDPTGSEARVYFHTTNDVARIYNGTTWHDMGLSTGAQTFTGVKTFFNGLGFGDETMETYNEGTFSPAATFTTPGSVGTAVTSAVYTKIGDRVHFSMNITITKGTGSGTLTVTGMPFSADTGFVPFALQVDGGLTLPASRGFPAPFIIGTTLNFQFPSTTGAAAANVTAADLSATATFFISGTYNTAAS